MAPETEDPSARLRQLARLVGQMRAKQRQPPKGDKSPQTVRHAKDLERKVDQAVADVLEGSAPRLF